jgi:futalosine hydrolase
MGLLIVTAVDAERDAVTTEPDHNSAVIVGGVGPAASAAATAAALARQRYDLVVCAGIGGGFPPAQAGEIAVASDVAFADLGVETVDGFQSFEFATDRYPVASDVAQTVADRTGARLGTVLTVASVTGTAERARSLVTRYPDAVAEGMEGAGVAAAATLHGVPFVEIRAISNLVGPRDRAAWRIADACAALRQAFLAMRGQWPA